VAHRDFEEFLGALNARGVRYLVVGAHAVAYHARPRATKDLDVYIEPTKRNARLLLLAMHDFFGNELSYTVEDLLDPEVVIQLGVAPVRIDLLNDLPGVTRFATAWKRRAKGRFGSVEASYLSLEDLMAAKAAANRPQDRADLVILRRVAAGKAK
jgi:predicted nucleotidyltransferase